MQFSLMLLIFTAFASLIGIWSDMFNIETKDENPVKERVRQSNRRRKIISKTVQTFFILFLLLINYKLFLTSEEQLRISTYENVIRKKSDSVQRQQIKAQYDSTITALGFLNKIQSNSKDIIANLSRVKDSIKLNAEDAKEAFSQILDESLRSQYHYDSSVCIQFTVIISATSNAINLKKQIRKDKLKPAFDDIFKGEFKNVFELGENFLYRDSILNALKQFDITFWFQRGLYPLLSSKIEFQDRIPIKIFFDTSNLEFEIFNSGFWCLKPDNTETKLFTKINSYIEFNHSLLEVEMRDKNAIQEYLDDATIHQKTSADFWFNTKKMKMRVRILFGDKLFSNTRTITSKKSKFKYKFLFENVKITPYNSLH